MSRGPGVVQRFILDYLAAGHPEPDVRPSPMFGERRRKPQHIGHPLWRIAAAYTGTEVPGRSTICSFGRAMADLRRAGLIEVRHAYACPYLRMRHDGDRLRTLRQVGGKRTTWHTVREQR